LECASFLPQRKMKLEAAHTCRSGLEPGPISRDLSMVW
jgi:hypothetical protein